MVATVEPEELANIAVMTHDHHCHFHNYKLHFRHHPLSQDDHHCHFHNYKFHFPHHHLSQDHEHHHHDHHDHGHLHHHDHLDHLLDADYEKDDGESAERVGAA